MRVYFELALSYPLTFTVADRGRLAGVEPPPTMIFTGPVSTTHLPLLGFAASVWK